MQVVNLWVLNKMKEKERVKNGKPKKLKDHSMESRYVDFAEGNEQDAGVLNQEVVGERLGEQAFLDLTDKLNDEFVYVY